LFHAVPVGVNGGNGRQDKKINFHSRVFE